MGFCPRGSGLRVTQLLTSRSQLFHSVITDQPFLNSETGPGAGNRKRPDGGGVRSGLKPEIIAPKSWIPEVPGQPSLGNSREDLLDAEGLRVASWKERREGRT